MRRSELAPGRIARIVRTAARALIVVSLLTLAGCGSSTHTTTTKTVTVIAAAGGSATKTSVVTRTVTVSASTQASATAALGAANVYRDPSPSMEPTVGAGTYVLAEPTSSPQVGDIALFHPPEEAQHELCGPTPHHVTPGGQACDTPLPGESSFRYVKRIVAGPGDEIYIKEGHVYRKAAGATTFVRENDTYIAPCGDLAICNFPTPIKIAPDHWFMLGDNRRKPDDSRFWGPVPTAWIIGIARRCRVVGVTCVAIE
jgi:signal peptidase I